ncbi:o-succinylbenzoate--CoA ligase [Thermaerobacter subterraneus]|uniref:2-succinylbenzoate--CoA ligase n=1 Tax=Thermaerobacter subterraneus DSM 13965 TaxID=867903 RepID=K6Q2S2_9FIRM|nr:o-succinylbenzoate--CoA ligase [Thermaerobacter subterraneus]EKP95498.1 2-succinylbenzoyl-CoA synthetase [Thermaerobacter subterraneus DSM 13965]
MPDWLHRQAELQPDGLALLVAGDPASTRDERCWTFAELDAAATALAERLRAAGVRPGQTVAVLAANEPGYVVLIHAVIRAGAVLVPLNVRLTPAELAWQVADSGAGWLIYGQGFGETAAAVAAHPSSEPAQANRAPSGSKGRPCLLSLAGLASDLLMAGAATQGPVQAPCATASAGGATTTSAGPTAPPSTGDTGAAAVPASAAVPSTASTAGLPAAIDLAAPHCIIYTSGTTGRPKGAVLTYGNHFWSAVQSALNLGLHRDDRWLCCVPLFHVSGLSIVFRSAIYGIPMVLHRRFDPAAVNASIERHRVTVISVVATMLQRMLDERGPRPYPEHLRCVLLGGGPAPRPLLEACAARGIPVVQTYGMTETASQFATLAPADALRKLGSAGKPLFFNRLRIVDERGRDLPPGQVGEIAVQGPTVSPGYHRRPDATSRAWRDGWFHTGDLGYMDEEGYLYVADRRDDLIISGGENVYPAEVEAVLLAHPAVEEAGVVGVPDPEWGQVPVAVVRLRAPHLDAAPGAGLGSGGDAVPEAGRTPVPARDPERSRASAPVLAAQPSRYGSPAPDPARPPSPVTEEALLRFCAERLARYKVPRRVLFTSEPLPRTASGKLQRHVLRQRLGSA